MARIYRITVTNVSKYEKRIVFVFFYLFTRKLHALIMYLENLWILQKVISAAIGLDCFVFFFNIELANIWWHCSYIVFL